MSAMGHLISRFPHRELSIRRLFAHSAEFRAICADYEEALAALQHWETANYDAKAQEYRVFAAELEMEILRMLDLSTEMKP
ncbi:hypothetical protein PY650_31585 [Rhizobium calliandrae]|uniref:Nodulation protein n=1 Tax=Rhizobium calliandrae TaxID=1312182 RepID=A0ABT7KN74_9HYPH|nr:hypothetical protein [Rhizobium calliandrae]MDL2410080.1 hypothetical protein [Rhizobium calliandrae]